MPPISLVKSRENLQAISTNPDIIMKYEVFDRVLLVLWSNIQSRLRSQRTQTLNYIIDLHDYLYNIGFAFTESNISELIGILKREYPGVDFTYKETVGYDGKIMERIIIMDWS